MTPPVTNPVVHLELLTGDLARACVFYTQLFGWRADSVDAGNGPYQALDPGNGIGAGVVQGHIPRALWLPYVEVPDIAESTARARELGACVPVDAREGPAGWRSVVATPAGAPIALWQAKR
jgi:uncharacterized protein